jgi:hypothetical protein
MSRVITFSRFFPATHPRKGEPTYFVEKIWKGLYDMEPSNYLPFASEWPRYDEAFPTTDDPLENIHKHAPKCHTIRAGNRWKFGDRFSPRVWSGKPYASKQIEIAPDIEIVKTWSFEQKDELFYLDGKQIDVTSGDFAVNDGLSADDLLNWFPGNKPFSGQVICWNKEIQY